MNQTALALEAPRCADPVAFQLGLDHARYGLAPEETWLQRSSAMNAGWQADRATFGTRTGRSTRPVRQWLQARLQAWSESAAWDSETLTPAALQALLPSLCPVTRRPLGGATDGPDTPQLVRLSERGAYRAGAVAWISRAAARARAGELDEASQRRRVALRALATALPHAQAAGVPLCVLPPLGLVLPNAAQRLQHALTLELAAPGWGARLRQHAEQIECAAVRLDFQLFVGALAPRALELPVAGDSRALQHALENLWLNPRVQQRFALFALSLGEAGCAQLLARIARCGSEASTRRRAVHAPDAGSPLRRKAPGPAFVRAVPHPASRQGTAG